MSRRREPCHPVDETAVMISAVSNSFLADHHPVIAHKRAALHARKQHTPITALRALADMQRRPEPVLCSIPGSEPALLIGQIRYAGRTAYDPVSLAVRFTRAGFNGLSLLTDELLSDAPPYTSGVNDAVLVTRAVTTPLIAQDYVFDEYQIVELRAAGASALLLHAWLLPPPLLRQLISLTQRNRMTPLVAINNGDELRTALGAGATALAIGMRDQRGCLTLETLSNIRTQIPCCVSITIGPALLSYDEAQAVAEVRPDAVMIDEVLLARPDAADRLRGILRG